MFEFTWARLGIFFALLIGLPLIAFGFFVFKEWVEKDEDRILWFGGGCVLIVTAIVAGVVAFMK